MLIFENVNNNGLSVPCAKSALHKAKERTSSHFVGPANKLIAVILIPAIPSLGQGNSILRCTLTFTDRIVSRQKYDFFATKNCAMANTK